MPRGPSYLQRRILLLLSAPLALGLAFTPGRRARIFRQFGSEWDKISEDSLRESISNLYKNKLLDMEELADGRIKLTLKDKGKKKIIEYKLDEISIDNSRKWDGKWRMVLFDIPHRKKRVREALRSRLNRLGFYQYQKSAFIYPYPCGEELDFLIEFYEIRPYVRQLLIDKLDNDLHLRKIFKEVIL